MQFRFALLFPLLAAGICAAQQPGVGFSVIGVAATETARINVLNEAPDSLAALGCRAVLQFFGTDGQLLKELTIDNLGPGKIAFLDFAAADRQNKEGRTPVRAVVRSGYGGGANPPPKLLEACRVVPNLEIFDADTGKTQRLLVDTRALAVDSRDLPL